MHPPDRGQLDIEGYALADLRRFLEVAETRMVALRAELVDVRARLESPSDAHGGASDARPSVAGAWLAAQRDARQICEDAARQAAELRAVALTGSPLSVEGASTVDDERVPMSD